VDKTGSSYYGKQQLHFMSVKGETSRIQLNKEGPIYHVNWSPKGDLFSVVHGFMPAKSSLFNMKGDQVFDFGTGPKNIALFNPQGNILMIGGFGNLRGKIDMWDVANRSIISSFDAPDTTDVKWHPDGQHLLSTTCAPRLRMGNGYKIWHYSGSLMHEKDFTPPDELWEADFQSSTPYPPFKISKQAVQGIKSKTPQESKQVYRPPGAKGAPSTFKLHRPEEVSPAPRQQAPLVEEKAENLSKTAAKNKKRRDAARKKREEEEAAGIYNAANGTAAATPNSANNSYKGAAGLLFDPEKEKKMKKIKDKLSSIDGLKEMQKQGKELEKNQLEKISKEAELLAELKKLSV